MRKHIVAITFALIAASCGGSDPGATRLDDSTFEHSGGASLGFTEGVALPFGDSDMYSVEYSNPDGDQVTGIIAYPQEGRTETGVLLLPGLPESAADNQDPLALFSCAGATSLAINPSYVRDGRMHEPLTFDQADRDMTVSFVVESRRAIDALEEMGVERLGLSTLSWGVSIGALLAGVEDRIQAYGLMIGHGSVVDRFLPDGRDGEAITPLSDVSESQREEWVGLMAPLDASLYVGDTEANILFHNGRNDPLVTPESAERLHNAAPASSEVIWFEGGHELTRQVITEHVTWLGEQLDLDPARVEQCIDDLVPTDM